MLVFLKHLWKVITFSVDTGTIKVKKVSKTRAKKTTKKVAKKK